MGLEFSCLYLRAIAPNVLGGSSKGNAKTGIPREKNMKRDLLIVGLSVLAVLTGLMAYGTYDTITRDANRTREGIEEIDAALERSREATRQRQEAQRNSN